MLDQATKIPVNSVDLFCSGSWGRRFFLVEFLRVLSGVFRRPDVKPRAVDHPRPELATSRGLVEQIVTGFRMDRSHQNLKADEILIDRAGTVKIIDWVLVCPTGSYEEEPARLHNFFLGTLRSSVPSFFEHAGTIRSALSALAEISRNRLCAPFPLGSDLPTAHSLTAQRRRNACSEHGAFRVIALWIDDALATVV